MTFTDLLNKTCIIQTKSLTQGSTGSVSESWANTYTNIPCGYNRAKQGAISNSVYQVTLEDFVFYLDPTVVVSKADRISIDGKLFEVMHVFKDSADHHIELFARVKSYD